MMSTRTYLGVVSIVMLFYMAIPAFSSEEMRLGLTFSQTQGSITSDNGTVLLSCGLSKNGNENTCDPYIGDALCSESRPLLCFIDIDVPAPAYLSDTQYWSGGLVAITDEVKGNRFSSISEANAYCAENFGTNWRVASFHDGGGWALRAYGNVGQSHQRVWVDIKDQAAGTCWTR